MGALNALIFFLLAALVLFAPLIRGGNLPMPLMLLELMALPLLAYAVLHPAWLMHLSGPFLVALGLLILFPLLQWLPLLPTALWPALPGREAYAAAQDEFGQGALAMRAISLAPSVTEAAWLAMLPALAVFLVTIGLREETLRRVVYLFLAMAAFQAMLGLLQFGGGWGGGYRLNPTDIGRSMGTYANRNHLAGLLEMALPIALGLLAARMGRGRRESHYAGRNWRRRVGQFFMNLPRPNQAMLFAALFVLLLLGLIFTRSRSGIAMGMIGILLSAFLHGRHIGGVRSGSLAILFGAVGLALAAMAGLAPVLDRFSVEDALADSRWPIYASSLTASWAFFPFGSGLGTFPEVYWRFQPDSIADFVNHVHNDYIEFLFEGGLPALVVMVMFLAIFALRWRTVLGHAQWNALNFMQVGAGIGLVLMVLHSLTDFNLHIPANAIYFALLAAVFFHRGAQVSSAAKPVRQERRPPPVQPASASAAFPAPQTKGRNPFAD